MFTKKDYENTIETIRLAMQQLDANGNNCSICGDNDHQAWECHFNPLVAMKLRNTYKCYHCGKIFEGKAAKEHFGTSDQKITKCQISKKCPTKREQRIEKEYLEDIQSGLKRAY